MGIAGAANVERPAFRATKRLFPVRPDRWCPNRQRALPIWFLPCPSGLLSLLRRLASISIGRDKLPLLVQGQCSPTVASGEQRRLGINLDAGPPLYFVAKAVDRGGQAVQAGGKRFDRLPQFAERAHGTLL